MPQLRTFLIEIDGQPRLLRMSGHKADAVRRMRDEVGWDVRLAVRIASAGDIDNITASGHREKTPETPSEPMT